MIRHTKAQRIGGQVALALPDAACETIWIDMDPHERRIYDAARNLSASKLQTCFDNPAKAQVTYVENFVLASRRQACSGAGIVPKKVISSSGGTTGRKLHVLLDDLAQLRAFEPSLHAVVFTHHVDGYEKICSALRSAGFEVCGFTGGVQAAVRHETIRAFQESAEAAAVKGAKKTKVAAKVFVATMRAGNVGVTLTAATRVYLMEPCLDPSMELQAAGRIHRLGQTKDVLVKKLCYKNSIDGAVAEIHKKISSGALSIVDNVFPVAALKILQKDY